MRQTIKPDRLNELKQEAQAIAAANADKEDKWPYRQAFQDALKQLVDEELA